MRTLAKELEQIIFQDPGNRKLNDWAHIGDLNSAVKSLYNSKHVLITTGFYIKGSQAIETDGPPGAIVLARALEQIGKKITIVIDNHAEKIIKLGSQSVGYNPEIKCLIPESTPSLESLTTADTTHFVSIERPGQAVDGNYYNHRGIEVTQYHAKLDLAFKHAAQNNIETIGVGDGGNELGLGRLSPGITKYVKSGAQICSTTPAKYCICAGVSNWAGYAMTALLSYYANRNLLPSKKELVSLLTAIVNEGAVDGISGQQTPTVDGLPQNWEIDILVTLTEILHSHLQAAATD